MDHSWSMSVDAFLNVFSLSVVLRLSTALGTLRSMGATRHALARLRAANSILWRELLSSAGKTKFTINIRAGASLKEDITERGF